MYGCEWVIFAFLIAMTYYHWVGRCNRLVRPCQGHLGRWLSACFSAFDIAIGIGGGGPFWCGLWQGRLMMMTRWLLEMARVMMLLAVALG